MNLFVGNMPHAATQEDLQELFAQYGEVMSVKIITDKFTGAPRGFGFVEMDSRDSGLKAISGLNEGDFQGRTLQVNEARPRNDSFKSKGQRPGGGVRR